MANYPQDLAQDAVCQSHTGHMTGLWFLPDRPLRLNTNEWIITIMSARPVRLPAARTQFPSTTPSSGYPKCWTLPKCFCVSGVWTHRRLQFGGEGATGASSNTLFLGVKFPNSPAYTASYFKKIRTGINYEINYQLDAIEYLPWVPSARHVSGLHAHLQEQ